MTEPHPIVLYDGVCGLCNRLVAMILRRDPAGTFRFAPLQGRFASQVLIRCRRDRETLETMYVVIDAGTPAERLLSHSAAAVYILERIRGPLRLALVWKFFPRPLRDWIYRVIAGRRYRWFGKYESCPLPLPEWKDRFLD